MKTSSEKALAPGSLLTGALFSFSSIVNHSMAAQIEITCGFCGKKKLILKANYNQAIARGSKNFYCNKEHFKLGRGMISRSRPGEGYSPALMKDAKEEAAYWREKILKSWPVKRWKDMTEAEKEEIKRTCKPPREED